MEKKLSFENSTEQAVYIVEVMQALSKLDLPYLERALAGMKETHSWRDSAAVLNPNPLLHNEQQELNAAKLQQLELLLKMFKTSKIIQEKKEALDKAKRHVSSLEDMFKF